MIHHPVLDQLAKSGVRLGLERVRSFLAFLDEPNKAYPAVHIGGTNGKGSTVAFVTQILIDSGYRVGTNYSPHLEAVNERIQINGIPLDDPNLLEAIEGHDKLRWEWAHQQRLTGVPLTYFEFVTTLAMAAFAHRGVDVAVFEVGMGGRLDATNLVSPVVTAVTSISLDHTEALGDTVAKIAAEKAGIFKRGIPVVMGPMPTNAREVIEKHGAALGCKVVKPGREMTREYRQGMWTLRGPSGSLRDLKLGLEGDHQGSNALVALGIAHQLRQSGFHIPDSAIRSGLENAYIPGRIERLAPGLVADGCHNEAGAKALARWLDAQPRPSNRIALLGVSHNRDPNVILKPLLPHIDEVVTVRCNHPKMSDPTAVAIALEDLDVLLAEGGDIDEILPEVYREADETLVVGSLFLAGAARSIVRNGGIAGIEPGQGPAEDADDGDVDQGEGAEQQA